jgi:hypothetical protein
MVFYRIGMSDTSQKTQLFQSFNNRSGPGLPPLIQDLTLFD